MSLEDSATLKSLSTNNGGEWESTLRHVIGSNPIARNETVEEAKTKQEDLSKVKI